MIFPTFFDSKNSLSLFELKEEFSFLLSLFLKNKFPKVLMLTGPKGSGKSTLIIHSYIRFLIITTIVKILQFQFF